MGWGGKGFILGMVSPLINLYRKKKNVNTAQNFLAIPRRKSQLACTFAEGRAETDSLVLLPPHMRFVKSFTPPDFQAKNCTPLFSPNFNSFGNKNINKLVKMETFTPLARILHCRRL